MSNVLITFWGSFFESDPRNIICYYESLGKELSQKGNSVLFLNLSSSKHPFTPGLILNKEIILKQVKDFKPNIIFAFNNQITEEILSITDCPIVVIEADAIEMFSGKELIQINCDRYYMAILSGFPIQIYQHLGFKNNHIFSISNATSIQREDLEKTHEISFIGMKFDPAARKNYVEEYSAERYEHIIHKHLKNDRNNSIYAAIRHSINHRDYNYTLLLKKHLPNVEFDKLEIHPLFDHRPYILYSLLDLGLSLYGLYWDTAEVPLAAAFNRQPMYTLKHNQDLYNSSKICLSISHPQTAGYSFPWRIYDIMASSGLLVTSQADLLTKLLKGKVKVPMYDSPYTARELCIKFLQEKTYREDIISSCNEFIEENGRWPKNLRVIEQITGITLLGSGTGSIDHISVRIIDEDKLTKDAVRARWKLFKYSFISFITHFPGIHSIVPMALKTKVNKKLSENLKNERSFK